MQSIIYRYINMKKILLIACLMTGSVIGRAGVTNLVWDNVTYDNPVFTHEGDAAASADGYIISYWAQDTVQGLICVGLSTFADLNYDMPEYAGYYIYETTPRKYNTPSSGSLYTEIRVWQYFTDGEPHVQTDFDLILAADLSTIEGIWTAAVNAGTARGTTGGYVTTNSVGVPITGMVVPYAPLTLSEPPPVGPNVPEPGTYAALAGLAMLAFAATRRIRK